MKTVYVFRHGQRVNINGRGYSCWSPDSILSDVGKLQMRDAANKFRSRLEKATVFACSVLPRACQSLCEMMLELGKSPSDLDKMWHEDCLWSKDPGAWCTNSNDPEDLTAFAAFKRARNAIMNGADDFLGCCQDMAIGNLDDGQVALCVSHGGLLDAACVVAKAQLENRDEAEEFQEHKDFGAAEGVAFCYDNRNELVVVEELRLN